ncbi:MraZ protein [Tranquillimonas rosea]|uniref:Transcriptional regulator MraZ n=1 Tax=Tranquillimonas rosea TaxID=641238 RepID=A0A1H9UZ48_9RHOB|nr:division/cell wall cluster transcriptional repressor MraZ [Tranquillimonas rosea]SES14800.1 MraZ protein [Tranquillimonas rosea]
MVRAFRGESVHKVDTKGRVSIPAGFRRVLEAGDPNFTEGLNPELVIVYGGETRDYLECFTMDSIAKIDAKISRLPRGSKKRKALQRLYHTHAHPTSVDETGRLVLPAKLREKIGLNGEAFFAGTGETFEIWSPEAYDASIGDGGEDEDFDPDVDPEVYLDGEED